MTKVDAITAQQASKKSHRQISKTPQGQASKTPQGQNGPQSPKTPVVLLILDGFGLRSPAEDNAISVAQTPNWDQLLQNCPNSALATSGERVGLPEGQMGNSEVGHMNLGSGRIIHQSYSRIQQALASGDFEANPVFVNAMTEAANSGKGLHILGLLSPGGVHSHEDQIVALCRMAKALDVQHLNVHAVLDGRDTPPQSARASLEKLEHQLDELGIGRVASIVGRFYAMDRDLRWERIQAAYDMYTNGQQGASYQAETALSGLEAAYARGETDEFVAPTWVGDASGGMNDGDVLICANFRPDRVRQISYALRDPQFAGFNRQRQVALSHYVTMTEYAADLDAQPAFGSETYHNTLGEWVAKAGKTQLRLAETEKYAHVTFFFNGGVESCFAGESRILVDSPKVATYDLQPEMSAYEVTDHLVAAIKEQHFDLIVCNYANGDMVGHTGNFDATVQAVAALDQCLGRVLAALEMVAGHAIITADHGNCEMMLNPDSGQPFTSHTTGPVPLVYVGPLKATLSLRADGALCDIAPSLLELMQLATPDEMTGQSLFINK